ncbi:MAG: site-specific integrase [Alphaproteobacteria bacterium]|nr:site-specific integrase [Alphaproteobacteria bacterium]
MAKKHSDPYRLYQRGEIWHVYLTYQGTQLRRSTGTTSRREAEEFALQKIAEIKRQAEIRHGGLIDVTVNETFGRYYNEKAVYQTRSTQTLNRLSRLKEWLNVIYLHEINEPVVSQMVANIRQKMKNATVNRYLALLSVILNTAADEWHYNCQHIKISKFKLKEPAENIKFLPDWPTAQKIIDRAPAHFKPIIQTALYTGMRLGNIIGLKWQQIDFTNNFILIKVKCKNTDGGKNHHIPLLPQLKQILLELPKTSDYVFLSSKGAPIKFIQTTWIDIFYRWQLAKDPKELTPQDVILHKTYTNKYGETKISIYKRVLKDPELPYVNFHTLRHTTATWLARAGVNAKTIKEILGHQDIRTTNKYMHAADSDKRAALASIF